MNFKARAFRFELERSELGGFDLVAYPIRTSPWFWLWYARTTLASLRRRLRWRWNDLKAWFR